jgi:RNA polymerase sigma-70 factor (TIGR02957 family)
MNGSEPGLYDELRSRAFGIAYRMLGSVSEAEDVVQEGLLRLHRALDSGEEIASPAAYLSTVVTRLAIDELRSARARRETYVGEWLPEPILTGEEEGPAREAEMADSLSMALLLVLETLTPEQRAVFLLREVFDYPFREIADVVGKSEGAVRQLAVRARRQVGERGRDFAPAPAQREELTESFLAATIDGDLEALESLLAADVVLHGDGGGKAPALARPLHGSRRAAKTLAAWGRMVVKVGGTIRPAEVNGQSGAVVLADDGGVVSVLVLEVAGGRIQAIRGIVNPDKLRHLGPVADLEELTRRARG